MAPTRTAGERNDRLLFFEEKNNCRPKEEEDALEAGNRTGLESSRVPSSAQADSKPAAHSLRPSRDATGIHAAYRIVHEPRFISTITLAIARVSNGATFSSRKIIARESPLAGHRATGLSSSLFRYSCTISQSVAKRMRRDGRTRSHRNRHRIPERTETDASSISLEPRFLLSPNRSHIYYDRADLCDEMIIHVHL